MKYELAKELKDNGFPQERIHWTSYCISVGKHIHLPAPTLSELIEACGDDIKYLFRETPSWYASKHLDTDLSNQGKTPKEAVARLWLALNKNEDT